MQKIESWTQLEKLSNGRGLEVRVYTSNACEDYFNAIISDGHYNNPAGTHHKKKLTRIVDLLKKYGFDIEYESSNYVVNFLKENLEPKTFVYGEVNFYFAIEECGDITMFNAEDVETLNCKYFNKTTVDVSCVEVMLKELGITRVQLSDALKELGWL